MHIPYGTDFYIRIGFALSEPIQVAGSFGRTTAQINVNAKVDTKLYTPEEKTLLSAVDKELDRICGTKVDQTAVIKDGLNGKTI
jgi:hypothetical protein